MKTKPQLIDPVCHINVSAQQNALTTLWAGRTVYFCSAACKAQFMLNPTQYFETVEPKRMGFWQKYLQRLNKATGGKPPSCCS